MPRLTVLLPARNAEKTVKQAVSTTLRGMPTDSELVVLDDGSTDSTAAVLDRISDPRLKVIHGTGSGGVGPALNTLLAATDSELVGRMDADDLSLPWRFATTIPVFERGADVVFSSVMEFRGYRLNPGIPVRITPEAFGLHLLLTNPVSHPTMIARRSILDAVGGYRAVPSEDYDLWLRCAGSGAQLHRVGIWGLLYRIHPTQITASSRWRQESWNSPEQAEAFADASERIVGKRLKRLVQIAQMDPAAADTALTDFVTSVGPAVSHVGGIQGVFLRRRLRKRLEWMANQMTVHSGIRDAMANEESGDE